MKRKFENLGNSKAQITADAAEEILKYMIDVCLWDGCVTCLMFVERLHPKLMIVRMLLLFLLAKVNYPEGCKYKEINLSVPGKIFDRIMVKKA